jgi:hypothetical protein
MAGGYALAWVKSTEKVQLAPLAAMLLVAV